MLFSITFGPDIAGKITMNFGAMNGDGGEKRLNVAVTRARAELHVFASVGADQIDLSRTKARGVADLKAFLDYAKRGAVALAAQNIGSVGPVESMFEESVRDALALRGWDVRPQIGVSGFRIDLGIRHPDHAGAWLAGVECDGAQYHSSSTARDRDRTRQAVLEGLGWSILRVWSADWFRTPNAALDRPHDALSAILEEDRSMRAKILTEPEDDVYEVATAPDAAAEADVPMFAGAASPVAMMPIGEKVDAEKFFDADYTPHLLEMMQAIIQAEGPILDTVLARKISQAHGWQRTGARIQSRLAALFSEFSAVKEADATFLWPKDAVQKRVPFRGLAGRSLREVSASEIARVIDENADKLRASDDRLLELSRLLGVARLSKDGRDYLKTIDDWAFT